MANSSAQVRTNNYMVTAANDGISSHNSQYGLLQNVNNRPKPKALAPVISNERRNSKQSSNQVAMSMDSKMMKDKRDMDRTNNSALI